MVVKEDLDRYKKCLEEIRKRMDLVLKHLKLEQTTQYRITNVEFVCLQFRKVIELVALISLVANKKKYAEKRKMFATDWNAKRIFDDLEKINPKFYPKPTTSHQKQNKLGENYYELQDKQVYLTKEQAIDVYDTTSRHLHALNPYMEETELIEIESKFATWYGLLVALLTHHVIELTGENHMIIGQISKNGKCSVTLFKQITGEKEKHLRSNQ